VDSFSPTSTALRIAAGSSIAFRVNASDVDSPSLFYTWTQDGVLIVASGFARSNLTINLNGSGMRTIAVTVEDNGTAVSVEWTVTVEAVPPGLVTLETPTEGQLFDGPLVVNASARVDPRLTNVTVRWTFNGIAISHFLTVQTPLLSSSGAYRFDLEVDGLYNDTVAYSARLSVNFTVRVPIQQPPNITNNTTGEQPGGSSLWIWVLIAVVVGAAVIAAVWARSRRAPPTPPSA
jgi:hypothetical protein